MAAIKEIIPTPIEHRYVIGCAYPAGDRRYFIRRRSDGFIVANDIEDRLYAELMCEAFNLIGERATKREAEGLCGDIHLSLKGR